MDYTTGEADPEVCQITLAGGCFWDIEAGFRGLEGILATMVGFTGGNEENPDYTRVSTGKTGHVEAARIAYDPAVITLPVILSRFFSLFDPTKGEPEAGLCGSQYRSAVFCHTEEECQKVRVFIQGVEASGKYNRPIVTPVLPAGAFWPAEECHQQYYEKIENRYRKPLF